MRIHPYRRGAFVLEAKQGVKAEIAQRRRSLPAGANGVTASGHQGLGRAFPQPCLTRIRVLRINAKSLVR